MREFKRRRSDRQEWLRAAAQALGALLLLVVSMYAVHAAWSMFEKFRAASRGQEDAQASLANLEAQKAKLGGSLQQIMTPEGQEKELRVRFGVVQPGEGEIDIVHEAEVASSTPPAREGWWLRVFHAVFVW